MADNTFSYDDAVGLAPGQRSVGTGGVTLVYGGNGDDALPPGAAAPMAPVQDPVLAPTPVIPAAPVPVAQTPPDAAPQVDGQFAYEDAVMPADGPPKPVSEGLGFSEGLMKPFDTLAGWLNHGPLKAASDAIAGATGMPTADQAIADHAAAFQDAEQTHQPGKLGKLAGEVVGTLPTIMLPGGFLAQGAASGSLLSDNPNDPAATAKSAALGAGNAWLGGKLLGGILGKLVSPAVRPDAQLLLDKGVQLTPGQIMGGMAKRIEDALTSTPILGDAIRTAQRRSLSDFNRAAMNDSLAHIGETVPAGVDPGRAGIGYVQSRLGDAYDQIAPQLSAQIDQPFVTNVGAIRSNIAERAGDNLPTFDGIIKDSILSRMNPQTGSLDGQAAKDAQTEIGQAIAKFSPSAEPKVQAVVKGLQGLQEELGGSLTRNSAPDAAARLADINAAYAKFARLRDAAAGASEKEGGMFTPFQLSKAVKAGDISVRKGQFAQGDALMQNLSSAGERVLPSSVPDSGTALRMFTHELPMLMGFGSESAGFGKEITGTAALAAAAGLPYSRIGQKLISKAITSRPWTPAQSAVLLAPVRRGLAATGAAGEPRKLPQLPSR